jgi:hypothetical protein
MCSICAPFSASPERKVETEVELVDDEVGVSRGARGAAATKGSAPCLRNEHAADDPSSVDGWRDYDNLLFVHGSRDVDAVVVLCEGAVGTVIKEERRQSIGDGHPCPWEDWRATTSTLAVLHR